MERLACFFMTARSIEDLEERILLSERLGYDTVGLPQIAARDPLVTLAAIAPKTSRIRVGTGVIPIWTRTPVALAQEAAVMQEVSKGRFLLGLGVGHQELVESWHGTRFHHPVQAMRDYVTILKTVIAKGMVGHNGEVFSASFSFMGYQPPNVPILIGALGPKMIQLAGEIADGVVLWLSSPRHVREVVMPNLEIGARRGGRDLSQLEILACVFAAPGPNRQSARDAIRLQLFPYLQLPHYRAVIKMSGFEEDLRRFDQALAEGHMPQALSGLSDELMDQISATGSIDEVAETLDAFVDAGCTMPGVGVVGRYDGYEGSEWALTTLREAAALTH